MKFLITALFLTGLFSAQASDVRVTELKREIMTMARAYEGKPDVDGALQKGIEEKVQDLEKVIPHLTMQEKAQKIGGAWRQVFGPYSPTGDGTIPLGTNTANIFQIIFPEGYFYNVALSEYKGLKAIILLKGSYKVTDEAIEGIFTRNSVMLRNPTRTPYFELPQALESGRVSAIHLPRSLKPVGLGGQLLEVYSDNEIRILRGKTASFIRPALYIMERAKR